MSSQMTRFSPVISAYTLGHSWNSCERLRAVSPFMDKIVLCLFYCSQGHPLLSSPQKVIYSRVFVVKIMHLNLNNITDTKLLNCRIPEWLNHLCTSVVDNFNKWSLSLIQGETIVLCKVVYCQTPLISFFCHLVQNWRMGTHWVRIISWQLPGWLCSCRWWEEEWVVVGGGGWIMLVHCTLVWTVWCLLII